MECEKCGNPLEMYWCEECQSNGETPKCLDCGGVATLDEAYHDECDFTTTNNDINMANDMEDGNGDMIDMDLINGGE